MESVDTPVVPEVASTSGESNQDALRYLFSTPEEDDMGAANKNKRNRAARRAASLAQAPLTTNAVPIVSMGKHPGAGDEFENAENSVYSGMSELMSELMSENTKPTEQATVASETVGAVVSREDVEIATGPTFTKVEAKLTPEAVTAETNSNFDQGDTVQAEAREVTGATSRIENVLTAPIRANGEGEDKVTRSDLVNVLETFVNLIKNTDEAPEKGQVIASRFPLDQQQQPQPQKLTVQADDKTAEIEELRCLLVEAQQTIIRLLTDRVEDRAHIAQLEAEIRLLPDLQAQADRAIMVAMGTEEVRKDLTQVKEELERERAAKNRAELEKNNRSWFRKMFVGEKTPAQ